LKNTEILAFRDGDALVVLSYTFRTAQPVADAETTLATLCPPSPIKAG
jgi:hypothetical protein